MPDSINVVILEHTQSIIDRYQFRFQDHDRIKVIGVARYGELLLDLFNKQSVDLLILEPKTPISSENKENFPVWVTLEQILVEQPSLRVLVISSKGEPQVVKQAVAANVRGFFLKDDSELIRLLAHVVEIIASGGVLFSKKTFNTLQDRDSVEEKLTRRQLETLTLCASYPEDTAQQLAERMNITSSAVRSLLHNIYKELNVHNRLAAISKARDLGWIK